METFNFTKPEIEKRPIPETGRRYYGDDPAKGVRGLGLTVTAKGSKTFHVRTTVQGQTKRIAIKGGKFPDMTVAQARKKAQKLLSEIAEGTDPVAERKRQKTSQIKLSEVLRDYTHTKNLKNSTEAKYQEGLRCYFSDYWDEPLAEITEDVIKKINAEKKHKAAGTMRVLKALFNFARSQYKVGKETLFPDNPVDILREQKTVYKYGRKTTYIKAQELPDWFDAVEKLPTVDKEYLLFLLFTGTRADSEAARLTWDRINWRTNTFKLIDTKNKKDVELPLPSYLIPMLKKRKEFDGLVFPIEKECRTSRAKVTRETGISFSRHDLRRTFLTIGESEDISFLALKRLSNHISQESDVTAGYIQISDERLRQASQKLETAILRHAKRLNANVVRMTP